MKDVLEEPELEKVSVGRKWAMKKQIEQVIENTVRWINAELDRPENERCLYIAEMISALAQLISSYAMMEED